MNFIYNLKIISKITKFKIAKNKLKLFRKYRKSNKKLNKKI
jgi:hypothetical protein